jgi:superoxide reductase
MSKLDIFKCEDCGLLVEAISEGECELHCGDKPMAKLEAKTADQGKEKHVPVIERTAAGIKVSVGSIPHPMEEKHFIQWIELVADGKAYRQYLAPGQAPEAVFALQAETVTVREYCNLHGLWKA